MQVETVKAAFAAKGLDEEVALRMLALPRYCNTRITLMDTSSYGLPPMPVTTPTLEQDLKLRQLQDLLSADKEDIITLLMALQSITLLCLTHQTNAKRMAFTPDHYARGSIEPWDYIRDHD